MGYNNIFTIVHIKLQIIKQYTTICRNYPLLRIPTDYEHTRYTTIQMYPEYKNGTGIYMHIP